MGNCDHNKRYRYTQGFQCEDLCGRFIRMGTIEYYRHEHGITLGLCIWNANVYRRRIGLPNYPGSEELMERLLKIKELMEDRDVVSLINEAESYLISIGSSSDASTIILQEK